MTLQTFITLLVIGSLTGLIVTLVGKNKKTGLAVNLVVACAGAFLGWFIFTQVSRMAMQVVFAIGGSLLLLWMIRLIKK
ncbi:MAG: GlsB/YeaQ/YmgE family stress response membrane protein [Rariglobus sp.]